MESLFYNVSDGGELSRLVKFVVALDDTIKEEFFHNEFMFIEKSRDEIVRNLKRIFGSFLGMKKRKDTRPFPGEDEDWSFFEHYFGVEKDLIEFAFEEFRLLSSGREVVQFKSYGLPSDKLSFTYMFVEHEYYLFFKNTYEPLYFGEVDDRSQYHGVGKLMHFKGEDDTGTEHDMGSRNPKVLYDGKFDGGKKRGKFSVFSSSSRQKVFEGEFQNDQKNGRGVEYEFDTGSELLHPVFEGKFKNGLKNGRGESHDLKSGAVVSGKWVSDILDPQSVQKFNCPIIRYDKVKKNKDGWKMIGKGGYGTVYEVKSSCFRGTGLIKGLKEEKSVAVKIMDVYSEFMRQVLLRMSKRGTSLSQMTKSPYILDTYGLISGRNTIGVVMKLCEYSVDKIICVERKKTSEEEKLRIIHETALGIKALHSKNFMHRDLKWANVLVAKDGRIKLTDFDTMKEDEIEWRLKSVAHSSNIGTPGFMAPEVFLGKKFSLKSDVYAFGLMIYCMLWDLNVPFSTQYQCKCGLKLSAIFRNNSLDYHIAHCSLKPLLDPKEVGKHPTFLIDIMLQCLERNPFDRPTIDEIVFRIELGMNKSKNKFSAMVNLRFSKTHPSVRDQRVYLLKPFKIHSLTEWIEKKFSKDEKNQVEEDYYGSSSSEGEEEKSLAGAKTKVKHFTHSVRGSVKSDEDINSLINESSQINRYGDDLSIDVEMEDFDETIVKIHDIRVNVPYEEFESVNKKVQELEKKLKENEAENMELKKRIAELERRK